MRLLEEKAGVSVFITTGAYHEAMLSTEPQFAHLEESFRIVAGRLKQCANDLEDAEVLTMKAMAKRNKYDMELDNELRMLELDLMHYLKKDRSDPLYKNIFPKTMSFIVSQPIEQEIESVKLIENKLTEAPQEVSKYKESLKGLREALEDGVKKYTEAILNENDKKAKLQMAKIEWLRQYEINYGEIIKAFPRERWRAENFFKKFGRATAAKDEESETQNS